MFSEEEVTNGGATWWRSKELELPDLAKVAASFRGFFASSGGLECDLGAMQDIIHPKRGSLNTKWVSALMALKLNPKLAPRDLGEIVKLKSDWEEVLDDPVSVDMEEVLFAPQTAGVEVVEEQQINDDDADAEEEVLPVVEEVEEFGMVRDFDMCDDFVILTLGEDDDDDEGESNVVSNQTSEL